MPLSSTGAHGPVAGRAAQYRLVAQPAEYAGWPTMSAWRGVARGHGLATPASVRALMRAPASRRQVVRPRALHDAEPAQVRSHPLDVEQPPRIAVPGQQRRPARPARPWRRPRSSMEHRLTGEQAADRHAVQPADQVTVVAARPRRCAPSRGRAAGGTQPRTPAVIQPPGRRPESAQPRDHLAEGGVDRDLEPAAATPQRTADTRSPSSGSTPRGSGDHQPSSAVGSPSGTGPSAYAAKIVPGSRSAPTRDQVLTSSRRGNGGGREVARRWRGRPAGPVRRDQVSRRVSGRWASSGAICSAAQPPRRPWRSLAESLAAVAAGTPGCPRSRCT